MHKYVCNVVKKTWIVLVMDSKKKYEAKRTVKPVSLLNIHDADIISHIKDKEFSTYVKKLIREDMKK